MIEVTAPGKLYIAGEYAVVEPEHPAISQRLINLFPFRSALLKKAAVFNLPNIVICRFVGQDVKMNWF